MSKERERMAYRAELGRQFSGKYGLKILRLEYEQDGRPDIDRLYKAVSKSLEKDVKKMTDETLGRIATTISELWGRRAAALLKLDYQLEKPQASIVGPEFMMCLAKCAIFCAIMDYLEGKYDHYL